MKKASNNHTAILLDERKQTVSPLGAPGANYYPTARSTAEEQWEKAGIGNAFIFASVMRSNPDLLLELLQYVLPEMEITGFASNPSEEVSIKTAIDSHGIRLDIVVHDAAGRIYDVEMQIENEKNIPRRIRYYGSSIDQTCLKPGEDYNSLRDSIILFITPFDPFGQSLYKYTFRNFCVERRRLELNDGTTKVILNAAGSIGKISPELKGFLRLVRGLSVPPKAGYASRVQRQVNIAKLSSEVKRQFMTWEMTLLVEKNKGKAEGEIGKLIQQVQKKLSLGQSPQKISEDLVEDPSVVEEICAIASEMENPTVDDILSVYMARTK